MEKQLLEFQTNNKIEETPTELNDENDEATQIGNYDNQHLEEN